MPKRQAAPAVHYAIAVLSVLFAGLFRYLLPAGITTRAPFAFFLIAVIVSAWLGGVKPGLLATVLGLLVGDYFFVEPLYSFRIANEENVVRVVSFVILGVIICFLTESLHATLRRDKQQTAALRESEERFRLLVQSSAHIIWRMTADGRFVGKQESWERFTGQSFEQYQDFGGLDAVHSEDRERVSLMWQQAITTPAPVEAEYRLRNRDNEYHHVLARGVPMLDIEGRVKEWVGYIEDITERKRLEEQREKLLELEKAARQEAENAQRLSATLLTIEEEARIAAEQNAEKQRLIQKRLTRLVDASAALLSSLQLSTVLPTIIDLAKQVVAADAYSIWFYKAAGGDWHLVSSEGLSEEYIHNTGAILTGVKLTAFPPVIASDISQEPRLASRLAAYEAEGIQSVLMMPLVIQGECVATLGFYYKTTHQFDEVEVSVAEALANLAAAAINTAELYEEQRRLREAAEEANRLKDEFLVTVSHELRTPLNAILGWATLLRQGKANELSAARAVETIERNARAQAQLVEDLLDVSRIISGRLKLDVQPLELTSVIKAAIQSLQHAADAKEIRLQITLDPKADRISGDAARLQQVLWNLLANAVKFTPKGGLVQVRLERIDSQAQVTVSDTGEGINPEFLPYVFERFKQADGSTTRRHGGLGLGLAIARHLVEMHGGTIEAQSAGAGQGASFIIRLPLIARQTTERVLTIETEDGRQAVNAMKGNKVNLSGLRVFVVDDERDTREMLKVALEQSGADVMTAASAREAFEAMPGFKPDVLVCDIGMPEEDGYSLIRKIRQLEAEQGRNTPAIALTGYVRVEDRIKALEAGFQMFVPKPVETDELAALIASLVGRAEQGRSA